MKKELQLMLNALVAEGIIFDAEYTEDLFKMHPSVRYVDESEVIKIVETMKVCPQGKDIVNYKMAPIKQLRLDNLSVFYAILEIGDEKKLVYEMFDFNTRRK